MATIRGLESMTDIRERSWPHSHREEGARAVDSHVSSMCCFFQTRHQPHTPQSAAASKVLGGF